MYTHTHTHTHTHTAHKLARVHLMREKLRAATNGFSRASLCSEACCSSPRTSTTDAYPCVITSRPRSTPRVALSLDTSPAARAPPSVWSLCPAPRGGADNSAGSSSLVSTAGHDKGATQSRIKSWWLCVCLYVCGWMGQTKAKMSSRHRHRWTFATRCHLKGGDQPTTKLQGLIMRVRWFSSS